GLFPDSNDRSSHQTGPNATRSTTLSYIDRQLFSGEIKTSVKAGEAHHASTLSIIVSGGNQNGRTFYQGTAQRPAPPCRPIDKSACPPSEGQYPPPPPVCFRRTRPPQQC
ncbi:unnamed protein product, partial [Ectocarpus sp. 8 AP-2014]